MDDDALLRYSRQIMLPQIDVAGQDRLAGASVLVIGVGGLGSPVAMYLAAAGIGRLTLMDPDVVELSNLQRQIAHATADIGTAKVESAARKLAALNPLTEVITLAERASDANLTGLARDADVVVDCSDNFATRGAVNEATVAAGRPLVSGAAIRFEGQISVFRNDRTDAPCYQCLYGLGVAEAGTCTTNGVAAPVLGVVGSLQAVEVMKLILRIGTPLSGRMLLYDALAAGFQEMRFGKDPGCPVCAGTVRDG